MADRESTELITLLISLVFLFSAIAFYVFINQMSSDKSADMIEKASAAANTVLLDEISALDNAARNGCSPLMSVVTNKLFGLSDSYVLYVYMVFPDGSDECFASAGVNVTGVDGSRVSYVESPCYSAARELLPYSQCRASVTVGYESGMPYIIISNISEV